jgi:hypothetical protein
VEWQKTGPVTLFYPSHLSGTAEDRLYLAMAEGANADVVLAAIAKLENAIAFL